MKNLKGFTIVELLVVIVVIGILASITVVTFSGLRARAINSEKTEKAQRIVQALELYAVDNGTYPTAGQLGGQGATGATLIGLSLSDFEPTGYAYPGWGIEARSIAGPATTGFQYLPHMYSNYSGFTCESLPCLSYRLSYWDTTSNSAVILSKTL